MDSDQINKGERFKQLHDRDRIFLMPNAWSAGSACLLAQCRFEAVGTTSAGIAYSPGLPDSEGALCRSSALSETQKIASAVDIPTSADAENGYGHEPAEVAQTIRMVARAGCVGASIEDYSGNQEQPLYDRQHAVERIRAASIEAKELGFEFTLTARAECYLVDHADPLRESIERANLYREAGADCLYVPGVKDMNTIASLVREIDGPLNVVMGLSGAFSVVELGDAGVRRVTIGGSLARATFALIRDAAQEMIEHGTFGFSEHQIPDAELCRFFGDRLAGKHSHRTG